MRWNRAKVQELLAMHYDVETNHCTGYIAFTSLLTRLLAFGKVLGEVKHATNIIHTGGININISISIAHIINKSIYITLKCRKIWTWFYPPPSQNLLHRQSDMIISCRNPKNGWKRQMGKTRRRSALEHAQQDRESPNQKADTGATLQYWSNSGAGEGGNV